MKINVTGAELNQKEIDAYINYGKSKYPNRVITGMDVNIDNDYANLKFTFADVPFERIRRITGYLVGTTDRFNNAKRAEEKDRVKHSV